MYHNNTNQFYLVRVYHNGIIRMIIELEVMIVIEKTLMSQQQYYWSH